MENKTILTVQKARETIQGLAGAQGFYSGLWANINSCEEMSNAFDDYILKSEFKDAVDMVIDLES